MKNKPTAHTHISHVPLAEAEIDNFRAVVYSAAKANPRVLPWRETDDPYRIMVSEIMLQQTQADRVAAKFLEFVRRFPNVAVLASSELSDVLSIWQGLGYNRRALALKRAAEAIVTGFGGIVPATPEGLESLPGIGPYTAGAIIAFAYNRPAVLIETNIRSVFIHHFFQDRSGIHDRDLPPLVDMTMDRARPRIWYNALMDYGAVLKREHANPSRKSIHHVRQSTFEGSNRQLRSALLKMVLANPGITADEAARGKNGEHESVVRNLALMVKEGLIAQEGGLYYIP